MGSHYMPSGLVAPVSQSKGAGINVAPLYFAYPSGDLDVSILVHDSDSAAAASLTDLIAKARRQGPGADGGGGRGAALLIGSVLLPAPPRAGVALTCSLT
jgi:hypothetical protein